MGTEFEEIKKGLLEAIEHAEGRSPKTRIARPHAIEVKSVRTKIGMTQEQFAARFGFSTATSRHWERGDRTPHGPALVLLNVIQHNPQAVIAALSS
jgi:putative transcriptional regulator